MTTTSEAIEVMGVVAACHHRTAPRMDDRQAVMVTAVIWADLFSDYDLTLPDLVAGVKKRATAHAEAPEPAEIIHFAREIRRDRDARRGPTTDYERLCESKADDAHKLANQRRLDGVVRSISDARSIGNA